MKTPHTDERHRYLSRPIGGQLRPLPPVLFLTCFLQDCPSSTSHDEAITTANLKRRPTFLPRTQPYDIFHQGPGFGHVLLDHTPLISGLNRINYELVCDEGNPINFRSSALIPEDVVFGHVWAILDRPLHTDDYLSTVWVHQVVER